MAIQTFHASVVARKNAGGGGGVVFPGGITAFTWLKAESLSALANNDPVATWSDSSGNGNDFTQGTSGSRPLYKTSVTGFAFPCVQFDGTDDRLTRTTGTESYTVIGVVHTGTLASFKAWLGERSSDGNNFEPWLVGTSGSGGGEALARTGTGTGTTVATSAGGSPTLASNTAYVWTVRRAYSAPNTTITQRLNGVAAGSGNDANTLLGNTDAAAIGSGYFNGSLADAWPGAIAEVLWYDTALSDGDIVLAENALKTKFSL